jgi:hypothetical protein
MINAMPKSGTHLLSNVVQILGYHNISSQRGTLQKMAYKRGIGFPRNLCYKHINKNVKLRLYKRFGIMNQSSKIPIGVISPIQVPKKLVVQWLSKIPPGHFIIGHVPYSQEFEEVLIQRNFRHILIMRDPRDVLLSFLHYSLKPGHWLREDLLSLSEDERIIFAIKGGYTLKSNTHIVGIIDAFRSLMSWMHSQNFLMVRFEDLVGMKGGGTYESQYRTIKAICNHLEIDNSDETITNVCKQAFDARSPTFRKGQIGAWKTELTERQLEIFNEYGSDLLDKLQYI